MAKQHDDLQRLSILAHALRWIGRCVPDIPYVRAIPNRVLKPLHCRLRLGAGVVDVLGVRMFLVPSETVDGNLWFAPHLYDRREITFLLRRFPPNGVLVDIGAYIGFWSMLFAYRFPSSTVVAVEANPVVYERLLQNIHMNRFPNVKAINVGAAEREGIFSLSVGNHHNLGSASFVRRHREGYTVDVPVKKLSDIVLQDAGISSIDVLKVDIEGYETPVLQRFFADSPRSLFPKYICAEITLSPELPELLSKHGYIPVLRSRENMVFELRS